MHLTKDMFMRSILPIGLLFSGSLILSNTAYLYLSVAYIQMLKVDTLFPPPRALILNIALGVHPRCHPPYLVVLPDPRAQPQIGYHCLHDFVWRCPRIAWRVAFQPHRLPRSGCGCRCMSHLYFIFFLFFHSFRMLFGDANRSGSITHAHSSKLRVS